MDRGGRGIALGDADGFARLADRMPAPADAAARQELLGTVWPDELKALQPLPIHQWNHHRRAVGPQAMRPDLLGSEIGMVARCRSSRLPKVSGTLTGVVLPLCLLLPPLSPECFQTAA